jgi:hypothetical protein
MPHRYIPMLEPIVRHGMRELNTGAPIPHVLRQVALTSALVGAGLPPARAHRIVESLEPLLIGMGPWERFEPYHAGYQPYSLEGAPTEPYPATYGS